MRATTAATCGTLGQPSAAGCAPTGRSDRGNPTTAPPQNTTSVRAQQRIPLHGRMAIDAIAEVFNVFDRPNWTIGTEQSTPSQYLKNINAQYRSAQVGFRLTF